MARSNARLEVSGAGKTEDGLVQYNEEVNKLGDDLRELYETIRVNVDEEEQWKVFDFVEDFFMEELEIGDYINDINSYHLHMFDKHDVTTKKLAVIVEKVGKVDANYAAQIEGYCGLLGEYGKKFETVCAMLALDLIGVKVFRYSDETAEAVASGEKLLKESGTIYESFADMMSPEDAKRYLDFLENGSREGLTGAELAGVEKADALLVSRKVEYEDVWDLRNVGDALESGTSSLIDIDAIRPKLKTQPDTAFFWSGRTDGIGGAENAANIAKSRGGVTLESTIEIQNIVMPEWDFNNPSTMEAWDLASGAYAEQVSGEIRAVIGSELRPGNIWENVELPRLKNNPNVTKITTIDPKTGVENVVFER